MRFTSLFLALSFLVAGCTRHQVDACLPACDADDQAFFAECVASGLPGECLAGNRRCCALASECVGGLDDQSVESTRESCDVFEEDVCWPPCDAEDETRYEACLRGSSSVCSPGDEMCCASAADCIGSLADWYIEAEGCCVEPSDCDASEQCDPMTSMCVPITTGGCGDGMTVAPEGCDDGNTVTEDCAYGAMSCVVCDASCAQVAGGTSYCGDGVIDEAHEECDPPGSACDAECLVIGAPDTCGNDVMDALETDVDCGGPDCAACSPGERCREARDCGVATPECGASAFCEAAMGICSERFACDDGNACTDDVCEAGVGCIGVPIDRDGDGIGPMNLRCGRDCDDSDPEVFPGAPEICDGAIDHNCDGFVDESC